MKLFEHRIATKKEQQMAAITDLVKESLEESKVKDGIAVVFSPHTTAGIVIAEKKEPMLAVSKDKMKSSVTFIIREHELLIGKWQEIFFYEMDGPRNRHFYVKFQEDEKK